MMMNTHTGDTSKAESNTRIAAAVGEAAAPAAAAVIRCVEIIARRNTQVYRRAFAAGTPVPVDPRAAAQVGRYDTRSDAEPITCFHSLHIPGVPLDGVTAVLRQASPAIDDHTCLYAVTLMRRYERATCLPLTAHMVHRLYLACLVVAVKVHHDAVLSTRAFASLCGVTAKDLVREERQLLRAIGYRALVTLPELEAAAAAIVIAATATTTDGAKEAMSLPTTAADETSGTSPTSNASIVTNATSPQADEEAHLLHGTNPLTRRGGGDDDDSAFIAVGGTSV